MIDLPAQPAFPRSYPNLTFKRIPAFAGNVATYSGYTPATEGAALVRIIALPRMAVDSQSRFQPQHLHCFQPMTLSGSTTGINDSTTSSLISSAPASGNRLPCQISASPFIVLS
jgi:hypothetical protein